MGAATLADHQSQRLAAFFDSVNHDVLMRLIEQCVTESRTPITQMAMTNKWLTAQGLGVD